MKCAWKELMEILPVRLARQCERIGPEQLQELRLRLGELPQFVTGTAWQQGNGAVSEEELQWVINAASRYSPWSAQTMSQGYLTVTGGHRIGICGEAVVHKGTLTGIRKVRALCIRVARDYPGIAKPADDLSGSILVVGPPGSGKTTLLRDLIRQISRSISVAVVDERCELFPESGCFDTGFHVDVLTSCPKPMGINMVLRTMGPGCIAVDEITAEADCEALMHAGWCGVRLLATAHGASLRDLQTRRIYRPLMVYKLFDHVIILNRDKTWHVERMD